MGQPVVHFEIMGRDGAALQRYYAELFGWRIDADNPYRYGVVPREENLTEDGVGIGGGVAGVPEGRPGHVTVYVQVPDVEEALRRAEALGGRRLMGPEQVTPELQVGVFTDPQGDLMGVMRPLGE